MTLYLAVFRQGQDAFQIHPRRRSARCTRTRCSCRTCSCSSTSPTERRAAARRSPARAARAGPAARRIEFDGVSFRYPGKESWALRDVNLTLAPGEKLGLVGENGAGKSDADQAAAAPLRADRGRASSTAASTCATSIPTSCARASAPCSRTSCATSSAPPRTSAWAESRALEDRAAHRAGRGQARRRRRGDRGAARSGYDTVLGGWFEDGQELSAGQWQKLAVARAFMRDAEVLILDEPTARIDAEAEHELFQRFKALADGPHRDHHQPPLLDGAHRRQIAVLERRPASRSWARTTSSSRAAAATPSCSSCRPAATWA